MTTADDTARQASAAGHRGTTKRRVPERSLAEMAAQPGVDTCDLCEAAIPGYVLGDLPGSDIAWVDDHTARCRECRDELTCYRHLDALLDQCCAPPPTPVPPTPAPSRHVATREARCGTVASPVGPLFVAVSDAGVAEIGFGGTETAETFADRLRHRGFMPVWDQPAIAGAAAQLDEYFAGRRNQFAVPLDFAGVSPFTRAVLEETAQVPFGATVTYRDIAARIGKPAAVRAVGNALNRNPIPLIVPCHRIVRSDATLGGYAGGPATKQKLLAHEGALPKLVPIFSAQ